MKIFIEQTFPLGRFHATPWKAFPYDDPHGEWPPSPWRLLRAVIARSYQLERETGAPNDDVRKQLVQAFVQSSISWHLPKFTWRGPGLRQYQPAEFKRVPASAKEPGEMTYNTTKVQDNFWLMPPDAEPILWRLESEQWLLPVQKLLAACLDRMTYFGRAESITSARLLDREPTNPSTNCSLRKTRSEISVPVLCPRDEATLDQILKTTDDKAVADSTEPPGAVWKFAIRPQRPAAKPTPIPPRNLDSLKLMQFAIGSRVSPPAKSIVVLTQRFRGRVIHKFLKGSWQDASMEQREAARLLTGKEADGTPLQDDRHPHTRFGILFDEKTGKAARLIVWRNQPFTEEEQRAILNAADRELPISFDKARRKDPWAVRLVALNPQTPPPRGFDTQAYRRWKTATPYVPPRHVFNRQGRVKPGESPEEQLQKELARQGIDTSGLTIEIDDREPIWTQVHKPRRNRNEPTNTEKRGYHASLIFETSVRGPIAIGYSSHFGLGLFVPPASE